MNRTVQVNQSEGTVDFQVLMDNTEIFDRCLEMARTRCLAVWGLLSRDQVQRYHHNLRSRRGENDKDALVYSLVAIGSRYVDGCEPTPSQANKLFSKARDLLLSTAEFDISSARLTAVYVAVYIPTLNSG
jgi:hypothetical protein